MLEPPNSYSIDLKQLGATLHHILIKNIQTHKIHVQQIQGRCFLKQKRKSGGALLNIAKGLAPQFVAIWCYLPLLAANPSAICRYCRKPFRYLPLSVASCIKLRLAAADDVYR